MPDHREHQRRSVSGLRALIRVRGDSWDERTAHDLSVGGLRLERRRPRERLVVGRVYDVAVYGAGARDRPVVAAAVVQRCEGRDLALQWVPDRATRAALAALLDTD